MQCYMNHDFYGMVASQVRPSEHEFYDIVSNDAINYDDMSHLKYMVKYEEDNGHIMNYDSWTEYCPEMEDGGNVLGLGSDWPQTFFVDEQFFPIIYGKVGSMSDPTNTKLKVYYKHLEKTNINLSGKAVYVHVGYLNGDSLAWEKGWDTDDEDELNDEDYVWELHNFSYTTHRGHIVSYTGNSKIIEANLNLIPR